MINNSANISVIIPCYNVEHYIGDCLDSIINQTCIPEEIICINDGSTDNTENILIHYATHYKQIRIISQNNLGVSIARNKGIKIASKPYIMFVDSDDIVNIRLFYEFQISIKEQPELELFYFSYTSFKDEQKSMFLTSQVLIENSKKYFKNGINLLNFLLEKENYSGVTWQYIFKRALFKEEFSGRIHEDHKVSLTILKNAKIACYYTNKYAYMHRNRYCSLSKQFINHDNTSILKKVLIDCFAIIKQLPISSTAKNNYFFRMNVTYLESLLISNYNYTHQDKENIKKELGYLKITIRINRNNKKKIIQNIFYVLKFCKKNKCSTSTKLALLKYVLFKKNLYNNTNDQLVDYSIITLF